MSGAQAQTKMAIEFTTSSWQVPIVQTQAKQEIIFYDRHDGSNRPKSRVTDRTRRGDSSGSSVKAEFLPHTKFTAFPTPGYDKKSRTLIERLQGNIEQLPPVNLSLTAGRTEACPCHPIGQALKTGLKARWLAWKVEFTASRLVKTILHAPSRDAAMNLLDTCRIRIGQMPATALRDALYIYTDRAVNRVEDKFARQAHEVVMS